MQTEPVLEPIDAVSLVSRPRRMFGILAAVVGVAALATIAAVVFFLITKSPGAAACDRLDELGAQRTVSRLERYVSSRVVSLKLVEGTERVEVSGCPAAMSTLSSAMSHKQFTKLTECIANATSESAASRCL